MELCECGHMYALHRSLEYVEGIAVWMYPGSCSICGCPEYKPRHDPRYDPDDAHDIGYSDEGFTYSGMGKMRR